MKKAALITAIVLVILVLVVLILPFLIDVNRFKPALEAQITGALDRKVTVGELKLALLSGGVTVDDISIADDPAFSTMPFLQARQVTAGVALMPLIFSKKLEVSSFTITDPSVELLRNTDGKWNYSSMGSGGQKSQSSGSGASSTNISVAKFKLENGTLKVGTIGPGAKSQSYQDVALEVDNFSYTSQFPFKFSALTPGNGKVTLDGQAGPINAQDASLTPLSAQIGVANLDLAATGFVAPNAGLGGLLDFNGTVASDGNQMTSKGTVKASQIKMSPNGSPATVPVNVDYATSYDFKSEMGTLTQGDVHVGNALAHLSGTYASTSTSLNVDMKLMGQSMSVPDLEGVLPAVGVTLPSGASLQSGMLDLNLAIGGPVDKLVITGPVHLANAKLAGFNLKQKLGALSSFTGLGGGNDLDTEIQTLSANVRVDPSGTDAQNLSLTVSGIGTITGTANVSASGQLNCKMVAMLTLSSAAGQVLSAISTFTGGKSKSGSGGIPFTVTGTTAHPVFTPDVKGVLGNAVKSRASNADSAAGTAAGVLGGLFGKKKSQ